MDPVTLALSSLGLAACLGWSRQAWRTRNVAHQRDRHAYRLLDKQSRYNDLERLHDAAAKEVRRLSECVAELTGDLMHEKKLSAARMSSTIDAFQRSARFKKAQLSAEAEADQLRVDLAHARRPRTATREELDKAISRWATHTATDSDTTWVQE